MLLRWSGVQLEKCTKSQYQSYLYNYHDLIYFKLPWLLMYYLLDLALKNFLVKNGNAVVIMWMKNYDDCIAVSMKRSFFFGPPNSSEQNWGQNSHQYLKIIGLKLRIIILRAALVVWRKTLFHFKAGLPKYNCLSSPSKNTTHSWLQNCLLSHCKAQKVLHYFLYIVFILLHIFQV